jgi:hypothetical protein
MHGSTLRSRSAQQNVDHDPKDLTLQKPPTARHSTKIVDVPRK